MQIEPEALEAIKTALRRALVVEQSKYYSSNLETALKNALKLAEDVK